MSAKPIRRPEGLKVTYRRMQFPFEQGFDRYWHSGSPAKSFYWTQLSAAFAPGEQFFIDSARSLKKRIDDPALLEELAEFCRQEGHHTAQHLKFDRINAEMGVDVESCRKRYEFAVIHMRKRLRPMEKLAATMALEHFTSCFAAMYFEMPHIVEGADPKVISLWAWHAAEEAEHKGTCYDIYDQVGGNYFLRVGTMVIVWAILVWLTLLNTRMLLWKDKKFFSRDTLHGLNYLFGRKGLYTSLVPAFFAYLSPRFHPWKEDNSHHIREWEASNTQYRAPRANATAA